MDKYCYIYCFPYGKAYTVDKSVDEFFVILSTGNTYRKNV